VELGPVAVILFEEEEVQLIAEAGLCEGEAGEVFRFLEGGGEVKFQEVGGYGLVAVGLD